MQKKKSIIDDPNKYRLTFDLHTHTIFSHGRDSIEDMVIAGIGRGLKTIGISDHGPGHFLYGMDRNDFHVMRKEIDRLSVLYPEINIRLGLEANIMGNQGILDVNKAEIKEFDYMLAGYHYGVLGSEKFNSLMLHCENWIYNKIKLKRMKTKVYNTEMIVKAIYENNINVLTHPGDKGSFFMDEIAKACADRGTLMEISTWHKHLTVNEIKIAAKEDVQFIISSDAHASEKVGDCIGGVERALKAGLDLSRIINLEVLD